MNEQQQSPFTRPSAGKYEPRRIPGSEFVCNVPGKFVGMTECNGVLYVATEDGVFHLGADNKLHPVELVFDEAEAG